MVRLTPSSQLGSVYSEMSRVESRILPSCREAFRSGVGLIGSRPSLPSLPAPSRGNYRANDYHGWSSSDTFHVAFSTTMGKLLFLLGYSFKSPRKIMPLTRSKIVLRANRTPVEKKEAGTRTCFRLVVVHRRVVAKEIPALIRFRATGVAVQPCKFRATFNPPQGSEESPISNPLFNFSTILSSPHASFRPRRRGEIDGSLQSSSLSLGFLSTISFPKIEISLCLGCVCSNIREF